MRKNILPTTFFIASLAFLSSGCEQKMAHEGRIKPLQMDTYFNNNSSARPLEEGVIPHGYLRDRPEPIPFTHEVYYHGRQKFDTYCSVCHDKTGFGQGTIVRRGFTKPPSYHIDRLRAANAGYFFKIMTDGFGDMAPYKDVLSENERWSVAAYIKALQRSQNASVQDAPSEEQLKFK